MSELLTPQGREQAFRRPGRVEVLPAPAGAPAGTLVYEYTDAPADDVDGTRSPAEKILADMVTTTRVTFDGRGRPVGLESSMASARDGASIRKEQRITYSGWDAAIEVGLPAGAERRDFAELTAGPYG